MKIVSSILPSDFIQEMIRKKFPQCNFKFYKGMKNAENNFMDAEVFITYGEDLTEELIYKTEKLRWIMVMSAGLEKMPLEACCKKGIVVTNVRGVHKIPMAEFTLGLMLQYVKQAKVLWDREKQEKWDRRVRIDELSGKTILILGVGAIGGEVARLAKAFRMNTLGVNRSGKPVDFIDELYKLEDINTIISKADFVVSVLPSTEETTNLITLKHFQQMKETAVFINIGRGSLVNSGDLMEALKQKEIAHAYLDVFEEEPLQEGHPFWKMENVTVTPHISSITKKYLPRSFEIFEQNLHTYIKKDQLFINQIDLIRGY